MTVKYTYAGNGGIGYTFTEDGIYIISAAAACSVKNIRDIITPLKAVKNKIENKNLVESYENDAVALVKGFYYIYDSLANGRAMTSQPS